jgi:hypothetical protein
VERSVGLIVSVSFSTPITSTFFAVPQRTRSEASASEWQKPAQPAATSKAAEPFIPSSVAMRGAAAGVSNRWVEVATITQSTSSTATPADSSAPRAAATLMLWIVSVFEAKRRVLMPDLVLIHSSLELIGPATSSFVTIRAGRYTPSPRIAVCSAPLYWAIRAAIIRLLCTCGAAAGLYPEACK